MYAGVGAVPGYRAPALILVTASGNNAGCAAIDVAAPRWWTCRWTRLATAKDHGVVCGVDPDRLA